MSPDRRRRARIPLELGATVPLIVAVDSPPVEELLERARPKCRCPGVARRIDWPAPPGAALVYVVHRPACPYGHPTIGARMVIIGAPA